MLEKRWKRGKRPPLPPLATGAILDTLDTLDTHTELAAIPRIGDSSPEGVGTSGILR